LNKMPPNSYSVVYHDLPISTFTGWDKVQQIEGMILQHDYGQLRLSAIFCDNLTRDDRINGVLETRTGSLMASPIECTAAADNGKARDYALEVGGDSDNKRPGLWETMFPAAVQSGLVHWGNLVGIGIAEIIWNPKAKNAKGNPRLTPRLKLWHPQFLYWDWVDFRWMLICKEGVVPLPDINQELHSDGKWVIYTPNGYQYGWLRALMRPLAYKYMMRGWNYRDWARYNERHGLPILGLITPGNADEDVKAEMLTSLANGGSDAAIALPQSNDPNGEKYDLKLIEATARSFDSFNLFKGQLDTDIAIAVLGQNLTTEVKGGSRAAAEIQNQVRIDKRRQDSALAQVLRDQVLWWDAGYNYEDPELAPIPSYQVEPPENETEEGAALKAIGDGVTALQANGQMIDVREMYEMHGFPLLSDAEVAANKAVALEEATTQAAAMAAANPQPPSGAGGGPPGPGGRPAPRKPPAPGAAPKPKKLTMGADGEVTEVSTPVYRRTFQGMPVAVENPMGTMRVWREAGAGGPNIGTTKMLYDYGYLEGVDGSDGEEVDVYLGPDESAHDVHVVHQKKAPAFNAHDEDKVFLGFPDAAAAKATFLAHRNDVGAFGGMSTIPLAEFKRKLRARTGTGKIRASALAAHVATTDALIALTRRAPARAKPKPGAAARRAARYPDRLESSAVHMAARALAGDLAGLKADIDASSDFDDLRKRIVERYKGMRPDALADIVRRVNLMAHLGGRLAAIQQL